MSREWFYIGTFGQLGPLTEEQIVELVTDGVIESRTYVWHSGLTDWCPASQVMELMPTFAEMQRHVPPPAPSQRPAPSQPPAPFIPPAAPYSPPAPRPSLGAPQVPTTPVPFAYNAYQPLTAQPVDYSMLGLPQSDKNRIVAGVLQILLPGFGRMYLGYWPQGVVQLLSVALCGIGALWSLIDGIALLCGNTKLDGYGRILPN